MTGILQLTMLVSLSTAAALQGAPPLVVNVWPDKAPGEKAPIGAEKYIAQKPAKLLTNVSKPTLTIFRPAKEKDAGTAVVVCPGGGYHILAWDLEGEEVAAWLNSIGVTGIILKYRVPRRPGDPGDKPPIGPLQDVQRAVRLVRSRAKEFGLDPQRIGVLGFSAGGHLAASASLSYDKRTYEPVDAIDEISCRPNFAILVYPAYLTTAKKLELIPELKASKQSPPTFFAHAADDGISADNSIVLYRALRAVGVPVELHVYVSGGHGFGLRPSASPSSTWPQRCAEWMRTQKIVGKPAAGRDFSMWEAELAALEKAEQGKPPAPGGVVFVGSSSIRFWDLAKLFPGRDFVNHGFGGSHLIDAAHFADRLAVKYSPRLVVLYAGDNDLASGAPPQAVAEAFKDFVKTVHEKLPKTRIVFLSIKPSPVRWSLYPKVRQANKLIEALCRGDALLTFLDVGAVLLDADGKPRSQLFRYDLLHLNDAGYKLWTERLLPLLKDD